jgi:stringent starvation protein B
MAETSTKPYMLRALHEWATDNGYTPHIVVQVNEMCRVPPAFVRDGQITLNISDVATGGLVMGNEFIEFQARFSGKPEQISVPVGAVTAIYARETGSGMGFEVEQATSASGDDEGGQGSGDAAPQEPASSDQTGKRPSLKIVK